jgi:hypothetical protein
LEIRKFLLRRLVDERCFSQKQMLKENIAKFLREDKKVAEAVIDKLVSQGLLQSKRKHYGEHIWLNMARFEEIKAILRENENAH